MINDEKVILYDGACSLCTGIIDFIRRHAGNSNFKFIPLGSEEGRMILKTIGFPSDYSKSVVYRRRGKIFIKSTAVLNILRDMGRGWQLLYGLIIIPPVLRDYIYSVVGRYRYLISERRKPCDC